MDKFRDGSHLWLWFMASKHCRDAGRRSTTPHATKCCALIDVECIVTKLYLCGKLTETHLVAMEHFGKLGRSANANDHHDQKYIKAWQEATAIIEQAARKRGWIED